ncbi:MAG: tyrosine-type recombinase/integrase, partial [Anaerolineaceae bacterium]
MAMIGLVQTLNPKTIHSDSLEKWVRAFIMDRKTQQFSKHTIKFYNVELRRFLEYCYECEIDCVESITPDILRAYLLHLEDTGRNPGGINAGYRAVKTFLIWYENEVEPINWRNPIRKVKSPKLSIKALAPIELEDVNNLLATCQGSNPLDLRDRAILLFLLDTGLRAFELCALDLTDIDTIQGDVRVHNGKGSKARLCMIGKHTRKVVRQYTRERTDKNPALWVTD